MKKFDVELVGKIGSMALIERQSNRLHYSRIAAIADELRPGYIWVTSGATEIGRLDYIRRSGKELCGTAENNKTDYAAQGQAILMQTYRQFIDPKYSVRQVLIEHRHFNEAEKSAHLKELLLRAIAQDAIPIVNYNDAVCAEENRKWEIQSIQKEIGHAVECVDNDETAAQIACLVHAKTLLILTNTDGIYRDVATESGFVSEISGKDISEVLSSIDYHIGFCSGASRVGANGAGAKLRYIKPAVENGTEVIIANAKYAMSEILSGKAPATRIGVR